MRAVSLTTWLRLAALLACVTGLALIIVSVADPGTWPWLGQGLQILGHLAAIGSVVALAIAVWQVKDARLVRESLSTRFIDEFPDFLPEIARVLDKAQSEIVIVCDFPSYGRFSKSEAWLVTYSHVIEKKVEAGVRVLFVCMTTEARVVFSRRQFFDKPPSDREWQARRRIPKFQLKLQALLKRHNPQADLSSLTFDAFIAMLEQDDLAALERTFKNAEVCFTAAPMPLYFWICDRKVGFFAFPTYTGDKSEFGFLTSDQKLIESFLQVYEGYKTGETRSATEESA